MKNAYVIIPDVHLIDKSKKNRYSYQSETDLVMDEIKSISSEIIEKGYVPYLIFLGDIFDNSYSNPMSSMLATNTFTSLLDYYEMIFSVIGNHELNFPKNNPFWALTSEDSIKIHNLPKKPFKALGKKGIINVVDKLVDGDVVFNFNHYSASVLEPTPEKYNIGLFHQEITCSPAIQSATLRGLQPYETPSISLDENDVIAGYDYSLFGHFHKYYGKWEIDGGRFIQYLGSVGRPAHDEVSDNYLERTLPIFFIDDGKLETVEDKIIILPSREASVKEIEVTKQQLTRKKMKERKEILNSTVSMDSIANTIRAKFPDEFDSNIIESLLSGTEDVYYELLKEG